jgi:hypothetical protein
MRFLFKTRSRGGTHVGVSRPPRTPAGQLPPPASREPTHALFDARFGPDFLAGVPTAPGVYQYLDSDGIVIYVGRAANLRRRLAQYRLATRRRRHRRMRAIVAHARQLVFEVTTDHLAACLREVELIAALRPRANIVSAYDFLYPFIGFRVSDQRLHVCHTTHPEAFTDWELHGAYRSRAQVADAFFALMRLFALLGHAVPRSQLKSFLAVPHARVFGFRRIPPELAPALGAFLRGEDEGFLGMLALALLERPAARGRATEVKLDLKRLKRFFDDEVTPLRAAVLVVGDGAWPVAQAARDALFLRYRAARPETPPKKVSRSSRKRR